MRRFFQLLIILILGALYARTIAPDLTWAHFSADGGDLISAAATGGVPHPSGYPLYLILARGFQLLPVGNLAFRTNLFSVVCTILTALLLYTYLLQQLRDRPLAEFASFLAALAYGLAPFVWGQALVTEVYALHTLLLMLCLHVLDLKEIKAGEWLRGFVFGIAAANHLTAIMMIPLLVLGDEEKLFVSLNVLFKRGLGVVFGLSLYLTLPVRAYFDPPINWGDASTLRGFFWLVSGEIYQQYPFSLPLADVIQRMRAFAGLLLEQYAWLGVLVGIYGLLSPTPRRVLIPALWMGAVFLFFAIFYGSYDSQVNLLPVWLVFAVWIAYGLRDLFALLPGHYKFQVSIAVLLIVALIIRIPFLLPAVDVSKDFQARDFVDHAVLEIPPDSLVFVDGDRNIFALWYAQFALGQRQDMAVIAEGLLPFDWYVENLQQTYPFINVPEAVSLQPFDLITVNPDRVVCYVVHDGLVSCE